MHAAKIIYSHYFSSEISREMIVFYYIETIVFSNTEIRSLVLDEKQKLASIVTLLVAVYFIPRYLAEM